MIFRQIRLTAAGAFCHRMGVGLRAGADLLRLLESEAKHGSSRQREAFQHVLTEVKAGLSISEAMQQRGDFFPNLMIAMTRVGEATGRMEATFLTMAEHYQKQVQMRRSFLQMIMWPMIQLAMAVLIISGFILLIGMLGLPDMLGLGLTGERGVLVFWGYLACFAAIIFALIYGYKNNVGGVQNIIPLFYMIPMLGSSLQTITLARFTRTLALSMSSGLDPVRSVRLSLDSTDSAYYQSGAEAFKEAVQERGATMAGGLMATDLFPDEFLHLVEAAELSGTESESVEHLSTEYQARAEMAMSVIAKFAGMAIWCCIAIMIIFMIFLIFKNAIMEPYQDAMDFYNETGN